MRLQGKKIATLVAEGVEDLEYYVPLMRLQEEGAEVFSAGLNLKPVRGKNGLIITPDTLIDSLDPDQLSGRCTAQSCPRYPAASYQAW